MTVVQPNSIAGINSISVQSGQSLSIHKSDGTLIREIVASTGISTFSSISVGSAATANNAGKSINIGLGASISQHADNTLSFGTNGIVRARITSAGNIGVGNDASFPIYTDSGDRTLILGSGSDDAAIQLHSGTDKYGGLYFGDATSGGARYQGYVEYKHDDDYLRFATGGTEKLRIISSGLVCINNDSPATVLDIKSTKNSDGLTVTKASNVAAFLGHNGSGDEGLLHLKDGGTTTIQIYGETGQASFFNAGKVGVGTAAPAQTIHLSAASGDVYNRVDTNVNGGMLLYVQGTQRSIFANDSAFSGTITDTGIGAKGNLILRAGTSSYDERLRIDTNGNIGVNCDAPTNITNSRGITIQGASSTPAGFINFMDSADNSDARILADNGVLTITADPSDNTASSAIAFNVDGTSEKLRIEAGGDVLPGSDATQDLGSISKRWANIYSADLQLSNEGSQNDVDGSWGTYTIQEGESDLFLINRRNGKKYKFNLTEVS